MSDLLAGAKAQPLPSAELNLGGTATTEAQFLTASRMGQRAAGQPLAVFTPGSSAMQYRRFTVRVGGRVTGGGSTNFTAQLYWGTSSTISSNTSIATTGAKSVSSASGNWEISADLMWDNTSQKIDGIFKGWVNATAVAQVVISNVPTSVDLTGETTANGLTVTGTFSGGFAGNIAYVDYFEVLPQ